MRLRIHVPEGTSEWESNVALFRVGRAESCALRLDGESAKYAGWEHAEFRTDDRGHCYIIDLESKNGTYIDGVRITEPTSVQIGVTVQIGTKGPKLEVLELTLPERRRSGLAGSPSRLSRMWVIVGAVALLLFIMVIFMVRIVALSGAGQTQAELPIPNADDANADLKPPQAQAPQPVDDQPPLPDARPETKRSGEGEERASRAALSDPWEMVKEVGIPAYRLIVVQDPRTDIAWPLVGAVVVGPQTLLTTADVGLEVAKFLRRGWRVKVARDSLDSGVPVDAVRILAGFQEVAAGEQLFFNMSLLSSNAVLTGAATLASGDELNIERGQPLVCVAIDHMGDAFDRFQDLHPDLHEGRAFSVPVSPEKADALRVLRLRGRLSEKWAGSPVFNERGHLVAIYCDAAPAEDTTPADRAIHYAKLIDPELIQSGLSTKDNENWVAPVVPPMVPNTQDSAQ